MHGPSFFLFVSPLRILEPALGITFFEELLLNLVTLKDNCVTRKETTKEKISSAFYLS